jgi:hypothetical protein
MSLKLCDHIPAFRSVVKIILRRGVPCWRLLLPEMIDFVAGEGPMGRAALFAARRRGVQHDRGT